VKALLVHPRERLGISVCVGVEEGEYDVNEETRKTNINLEVTIAHAPPSIVSFNASVVRQEGLHVYDIDKGERVCIFRAEKHVRFLAWRGIQGSWEGVPRPAVIWEHLKKDKEKVDERGIRREI